MAVNTFVPTALANTTATPDGGSTPVVDPNARQQAQASFEWFDYGQYIPGSGTRWETNPPFSLHAGEKLVPHVISAAAEDGVPPHILRGYIRRAAYNVADRPSKCRLQFLYNPTQITRNYVSYLDQGALDPFNTVYQSGNLVAPPSFMDFTFELLFDRQEESTDPKNRGVLVDMDYFDLVVRNVVPTSSRTANSLPDNGVMMVNPRDITVVFSPELTIQGRPTNAQIIFQKFTHRMTPTRMTIALTMRVVYLGPVRDLTTFVNEEVNVARRVPFDIKDPQKYGFSYNKLEWTNNGEDIDPKSIVNGTPDQLSDIDVSGNGGAVAAEVAYSRWQENGTLYDKDRRNQLWKFADCSSFVWGGFADNRGLTGAANTQSMAEKLGWPKWGSGYPTDTAGMFNTFANDRSKAVPIWGGGGLTNGLTSDQWPILSKDCQRGDILLRHNNPRREGGHVAFVWTRSGDRVEILHAASPSQDVEIGVISVNSTIYYNYAFRIALVGQPTLPAEQDEDTPVPEVDVQGARKPGAPTNLEIQGGGDPGTADCWWKRPSDQGSTNIVEYRIEYAKSSSPDNWTNVVVSAATGNTGSGPRPHAMVSDLDSEVKYRFRVRAANDSYNPRAFGPASGTVEFTPR